MKDYAHHGRKRRKELWPWERPVYCSCGSMWTPPHVIANEVLASHGRQRLCRFVTAQEYIGLFPRKARQIAKLEEPSRG